jgi:hypothetical protein
MPQAGFETAFQEVQRLFAVSERMATVIATNKITIINAIKRN